MCQLEKWQLEQGKFGLTDNDLFCFQGCDGVFVPFASVSLYPSKPFLLCPRQCPDSCGVVGRKHRDVQCVDSQSRRPLRPFHCQNVSSRPASSLACPQKPCVTWSISPWGPVGTIHILKNFISVIVVSKDHYYRTKPPVTSGLIYLFYGFKQQQADSRHDSCCYPQCSGSCGEGMRERLVYCPAPHRCNTALRPNSTEACELKPCAQWKAEDWEQVAHTPLRSPRNDSKFRLAAFV